jgi:3-dehydroquinate dehydratase-2
MVSQTPYLLLVNGPNLNRLGKRDPATYGTRTLLNVTEGVLEVTAKYGVQVESIQSNHEGELIDFLQTKGPGAIGIVINPGALGHYSYALRDCLDDISIPAIEVHISNVHCRESFRHQLVLSPVVSGQIVGLGTIGYQLAAQAICASWIERENGETI